MDYYDIHYLKQKYIKSQNNFYWFIDIFLFLFICLLVSFRQIGIFFILDPSPRLHSCMISMNLNLYTSVCGG